MSDYKPPYTITEKMLSLVSSISEKVGQISAYHSLESKPHLRRNNKIRSIHSSLKIEANSLSLGEVREVINGHHVLGSRNEIQEVKNAYEAYEHISDTNPYSLQALQKMQGILTQNIQNDAGKFRNGEEGVFAGQECIFMAPPAKMVPELMKELFDWMNQSKKTVHPLILAAVFHYEFVFIHPFSDGNGRTARLWHTILLSKWNSFFEFIPLESQIEKFQKEYYDAIAACHVDGESNRFIEFILEQLDSILSDVLNQTNLLSENLSEYTKRLLENMEFGVPYTANALLNKLGLKSKETFRKHYLNPAMEKGLVIMTIPEKPKSRNQRYVKNTM